MKYLDLQKRYKTLIDEVATRSNSRAALVAVTKNHSWGECSWLYESGCRNFGENRAQEAFSKINQAPSDAKWHFIGTLQKNKVAKVVGNFSLIHSVDSLELAQKISSVSQERDQVTNILLQVNIEHQHGFKAGELIEAFEKLKALSHINIKGLMTMAPETEDKHKIKSVFHQARQLKDQLGLQELSMGMSNDWQVALDEGATLLRIGSYLFH